MFDRPEVSLFALPLLTLLFGWATVAGAGEFHQDIERDFALRSIGQLQVTNMRGDIVVQGWPLDKIRVKARRRAVADTEADAKKLFAAVDFRYRTLGKDIELSAEYGRGLEIQERLKERENPKTGMEMTVYAPANLQLHVWGADGKVTVRGWSGTLEVRTASGAINIESVKTDNVSLLCPTCPIAVRSTRASVRCMGGTGAIELDDVTGQQMYAESSTGAINAAKIRAEQLYVSKSGPITGKELRGRIEFHTQQAPVNIEGSGFLSGRTESGDINAQMKRWVFSDKAILESTVGRIRLALPASFSGDLDVWSLLGKAEVGFPVERSPDYQQFGPEPLNRILGRVGQGGDLLKVFSEKGDVQVVHLGG